MMTTRTLTKATGLAVVAAAAQFLIWGVALHFATFLSTTVRSGLQVYAALFTLVAVWIGVRRQSGA